MYETRNDAVREQGPWQRIIFKPSCWQKPQPLDRSTIKRIGAANYHHQVGAHSMVGRVILLASTNCDPT
eukprot:scaffold75_cov165-Amphora_coffeaeformis.AAC.12